MTFTIPSLPPSKNILHSVIRRPNMPLEWKRSGVYTKWLNEALPYIPMLKPLVDSHYFGVEAVFNYPFFHENGHMKRKDSHNFLEALCDAIATKNGFDDSYVKFGSFESYDAKNESTVVRLVQWKSA